MTFKSTLTHPYRLGFTLFGVARDTTYFGIGVTTRLAATALNSAATLVGRERGTAPPVEPMPGPGPMPAPGPGTPEPGPAPMPGPGPGPGPEPVPEPTPAPDPVGQEEELLTPAGIPAADPGRNPDTTDEDLHQTGTEPLLDASTVKSVMKETNTLRRAAALDKA